MFRSGSMTWGVKFSSNRPGESKTKSFKLAALINLWSNRLNSASESHKARIAWLLSGNIKLGSM
jgi:hypothetical protein